MSTAQRRWGPLASLLLLSPLLIGIPLYTVRYQYALPTPLTDLYDPKTHLPQISESTIIAHARYLSEDIGYRTVGTKEHALGDAWMVSQAEAVLAQCNSIIAASPHRGLECEVWRQDGNGSHRFDMMGRRLYKTYVGLSNVIVRVSNGTREGKEHAVLINSHVDSTLPSPGAADDALSVGIMLECIRVLIETPGWSPLHAAIFLFNNAEESLQDGSHLFSTQHPIAHTVRAAINLEAAGTTGRDMLFQATSEQMLEAYSHVPRPFGSVVANEVFSSGVIMSDTDFRQFEQYLNVTGLDMAVVGNSYLYHMRKDLVENITPGTAQHMAENTLALIRYLTAHPTSLPSLISSYKRPTSIFFTNLGTFFMYGEQAARVMYSALAVGSFVLVSVIKRGGWGSQVKGAVATVIGAGGALLGANVAAFGMEKVLGKGLSWFSHEFLALALYGPAALTGVLVSQRLIGPVPEHTMFTSLLLLQSTLALVIQLRGIGSAGLFFLSGVPLFLALALNAVLAMGAKGRKGQISLWTYAVAQVAPLMIGGQMMTATLDVFVPLTGRIGGEAPAEHMIATIVAALGAYNLPLLLPFAHRFGPRVLGRAIVLACVVTVATMAVFSAKEPFDAMHQKRLFVLHHEDLQTHQEVLHLAAADSAPGFDKFIGTLAKEFGVVGKEAEFITMNDNNTDWNSLYPFSAFLSPYKIGLPLDANYVHPANAKENIVVSAVNETIDEVAGTRSFTLQVYHPGVIWSVIAFNAHVVKWTLDDSPPDEVARHHIKEASFYGKDTYSVGLTVKLASSPEGILVDYIGVAEQRMWPGKKAEKEAGGRAMVLFEKFDRFVEETSEGKVDVMLLGCVGGQSTI